MMFAVNSVLGVGLATGCGLFRNKTNEALLVALWLAAIQERFPDYTDFSEVAASGMPMTVSDTHVPSVLPRHMTDK